MCQPPQLPLHLAVSEFPHSSRPVLKDSVIQPSPSLPLPPQSLGAKPGLNARATPCIVIDADEAGGTPDIASWQSPLLFSRQLFTGMESLSGKPASNTKDSPRLPAPGSAFPCGSPQLRIATEDKSPDWAQRTVNASLWEGGQPLSSTSSDNDTDTSEASTNVLLHRHMPRLGSTTHHSMPLLISVDDDDCAGFEGSGFGGSSRFEGRMGAGVVPARGTPESLAFCDGRINGPRFQASPLAAIQRQAPAIPREMGPPLICQTVPELGRPDCHMAASEGQTGTGTGDTDREEGLLVVSCLSPPSGHRGHLPVLQPWPAKANNHPTVALVPQDVCPPRRAGSFKPSKGAPMPGVGSCVVSSSPFSSIEPGQYVPILPSPLGRQAHPGKASQMDPRCSLPPGRGMSGPKTRLTRHHRRETDTSLLEGKLELLSLQRSIYAAKCQLFLDYLEAHAEDPTSTCPLSSAGSSSSGTVGIVKGRGSRKVPRIPRASSMQGIHVIKVEESLASAAHSGQVEGTRLSGLKSEHGPKALMRKAHVRSISNVPCTF